MPNHLRFTESALNRLPIPPPKTKVTYLDADPAGAKQRLSVSGLELVVSYTGVKSFVLRRKLNGRVVAVTIGRHPSINVDTARKLARKAASKIAEGINPNLEKRANAVQGITLGECYIAYKKDRSLARNTESNYDSIMNNQLSSWVTKPMKLITRDMVERKHKILSKHSQSSADKTMRILGSLFKYAHASYEDSEGRGLFPDNPTIRLSAKKLWHGDKPRKDKIQDEQLASWFAAVLNPKGKGLTQTVSDLLIFILLTGLRRREASNLTWEQVSFEKKCFHVYDTKNKDPLILPLSDYLYSTLERRKKESESVYIFAGSTSEKPIQEPKRQIVKLRAESGIQFTIHDLRRTFASVAESCEIPPYALKALVNHKLPKGRSGDITQDYIQISLERLRKPMQKITDYILKSAELKKTTITELPLNKTIEQKL